MSDMRGGNTLGDLVSIRTGKLDVNAGSVDGRFPFFTCARETQGIDTAAFSGEAVIVAGNGDLNVKYFEGEFNAYQRTYVMQKKPNSEVTMKYIFLFLEKYIETLRANSSGSVIKYIKLPDLRDAEVSLPPLPVQRRIVDLMAHLDNHLANLRAEGKAAERIIEALAREPWRSLENSQRVGDCGRVITGSTPSTKNSTYWDLPSTPFVTPGDIGGLGYVNGTSRYVSSEGVRVSRPISKNSVMVVCIGATIGKVGVATQTCVTNQQINSVTDMSASDAFFLALVLSAPEGQNSLTSKSGQTAVPLLNKSQFSSVLIPWPSGEERQRVGHLGRQAVAIRDALALEVQGASALRGALLSHLISGSSLILPDYDSLLSEVA
ncbi:MAG TPA: restriction endonuclease subunit S [Candidatus Nanopelagicaceae bacterium]|nr:restriction endonuclease subunit S [Candidatus Nanopelagicaceae bacterium]